MEGPNLFIDFSIIQKSPLQNLTVEFDKVIRAGKLIFVWSKTVAPLKMEEHCKSLIIHRKPEEKTTHANCHKLRAEGKLYSEIAEELKIALPTVSFYTTTDPNREWTLDDWIQDYKSKDSTVYSKVDILADPDPKVVDRFKRQGIEAHLIEKL